MTHSPRPSSSPASTASPIESAAVRADYQTSVVDHERRDALRLEANAELVHDDCLVKRAKTAAAHANGAANSSDDHIISEHEDDSEMAVAKQQPSILEAKQEMQLPLALAEHSQGKVIDLKLSNGILCLLCLKVVNHNADEGVATCEGSCKIIYHMRCAIEHKMIEPSEDLPEGFNL